MAVRSIALLSLASSLAACTYGDSGDYAVIPSWLINGVAPDAAQCTAFGVDRIQFQLLSGHHRRTLEGSCDEGVIFDDGDSYGGFITTTSFEYDRTYDYEIRMVDTAGRTIQGLSAQDSFQVYIDDYIPYLLNPIEIFQPEGKLASYDATWELPSGETCASLDIDHVDLVIASRTDPDFTNALVLESVPCGSGELASAGPALAYGHYFLKLQALSAGNALVDEGAPFEALVDVSGNLTLDPVRFDGR